MRVNHHKKVVEERGTSRRTATIRSEATTFTSHPYIVCTGKIACQKSGDSFTQQTIDQESHMNWLREGGGRG